MNLEFQAKFFVNVLTLDQILANNEILSCLSMSSLHYVLRYGREMD